MPRKLVTACSWALVALIVCVTLSPIGLRPHMGGPGFERFSALALLGLMLGLAYPRRFWTVLLAICLGTLLLEASQYLTPDRHGRLSDALVKMMGGVVGVSASWCVNRLYGWFSHARATNSSEVVAKAE